MINNTLKQDFYDSMIREFKSVKDDMNELPEEKMNPIDFYDIRDLFLRYVNWRKRFISRGVRKVFYSKELKEKLSNNKKLKRIISKLEYKFKNKEDITPFLTKQIVHKSYIEETGTKVTGDKDLLLNFFGIQHLHLENSYSNNELKGIIFSANSENRRGADLLYAKVEKDKVYFIDINEHELFDKDILKVMKDNWEYLLKEYESSLCDVTEFTNEESIKLLKSGITAPYKIDDKIYSFSAISIAGTSTNEFFQAQSFFQDIQKQYNELMIIRKKDLLLKINRDNQTLIKNNKIDIHIIIKNGLLFFVDDNSNSTIKFEDNNIYISKNNCEIGYHTYDFNT